MLFTDKSAKVIARKQHLSLLIYELIWNRMQLYLVRKKTNFELEEDYNLIYFSYSFSSFSSLKMIWMFLELKSYIKQKWDK